jgi:hypothetical protein
MGEPTRDTSRAVRHLTISRVHSLTPSEYMLPNDEVSFKAQSRPQVVGYSQTKNVLARTGKTTYISSSRKVSTSAKAIIDIQHALFKVSMGGKLHLAPIAPNLKNVLDFATGQYP